MKKMALAATLLAVFMMGCSDTGVDNSVASGTSRVLDEKSLEFFKTGVTEFKEVPKSEPTSVLKKSGDEISEGGGRFIDPNENYALNINSEVREAPDSAGFYKGNHFMSVNSKSNIGPNFCGAYPTNWCLYYGYKFLHMYGACVRGCSANGICNEHKTISLHDSPTYNYGLEGWCDSIVSRNRDDIGLVTVAAAVIEGGNVILQGAVRDNLSNDMALKVYRNYILPEALADAGN